MRRDTSHSLYRGQIGDWKNSRPRFTSLWLFQTRFQNLSPSVTPNSRFRGNERPRYTSLKNKRTSRYCRKAAFWALWRAGKALSHAGTIPRAPNALSAVLFNEIISQISSRLCKQTRETSPWLFRTTLHRGQIGATRLKSSRGVYEFHRRGMVQNGDWKRPRCNSHDAHSVQFGLESRPRYESLSILQIGDRKRDLQYESNDANGDRGS